MVMELVIISPFVALWFFKIMPLWMTIICIATLYWIPKWLISILEYLFPQIIFRSPLERKKIIALTFDDVPYQQGSHNEIISLLDQYEAKGTFFCILDDAKNSYPSLVHAVNNGHQLANHGCTNSIHGIKNAKQLEEEITKCDIQIKKIYNEAAIPLPQKMIYRPGYGLFNGMMIEVANKLGYQIALGSVYPNDPSIILDFINYWYLIYHIEGGDIVVLHDRKWTPGLLKMLLPWLKNNGYRCVTLDNLL